MTAKKKPKSWWVQFSFYYGTPSVKNVIHIWFCESYLWELPYILLFINNKFDIKLHWQTPKQKNLKCKSQSRKYLSCVPQVSLIKYPSQTCKLKCGPSFIHSPMSNIVVKPLSRILFEYPTLCKSHWSSTKFQKIYVGKQWCWTTSWNLKKTHGHETFRCHQVSQLKSLNPAQNLRLPMRDGGGLTIAFDKLFPITP